MEKQKIYVSQAGYDQYMEALAQSKAIYDEKLKERTRCGKNRVGADGDYQTGTADTELQIATAAVSDLEETISRLIEN